MWLLKGNARRVRGGREGRRYCPECEEITTFVECDLTDKLKLFYVLEVMQATSRQMVCTECAEAIDMETFFGAPDKTIPAPYTRPPDLPRPAAPSRLTGEKKKVSEAEKEEMLRALKQKMGKRGDG